MTDQDSTSRDEGVALATELRSIAEALVVVELAPEDVAEARRLAIAMRERLAGPLRRRWYDADDRPRTSSTVIGTGEFAIM